MAKIIFPTLKEVEYLASHLSKEFPRFDEDVPDFSTRFPNVLESCIAVPQQKFSGKYLYSGLYEKASILFYLMIKNHPFQNGNKRIAVMALLYFLHKNNKWLKISAEGLYLVAKYVASSLPESKDEVIATIQAIISTNIKKRE